jgi:hypothetical protein
LALIVYTIDIEETMIQFYFLSVLLNAVAGLILLNEGGEGDRIFEGDIFKTVNNDTFKLIIGIASLVTGLLKLLSATEGDIPIVGDLVPALTGLISGYILCFDYYASHSTLDSQTNSMAMFFISGKKLFGIAAVAAAALHFLFAKVLFL